MSTPAPPPAPSPVPPPAHDPTCGVAVPALRTFLGPRHWPVWIALGLLRLLALVPWPWHRGLARALAALGWVAAARERRTTLVNLAACFPELDADAQRRLAREHFASLVLSVFETASLWFGDRAAVERRCTVEGLDLLRAGLTRGKGVLLVSAHFTTNEMAAAALWHAGLPVDVMYKRSKSPLIQAYALRKRAASAPPGARMIPSEGLVELLRTLKRGGAVLYAPDQRYDGPGYVRVPFFGVPALANPGITTLARATGCTVLFYFPRRLPDGSGFQMQVLAAPPYFPSTDPAADVARYHRLIEDQVRAAPAQYLWSYKRFRPLAGEPDPYHGGRLRGSPGA